MKGWVFPTGWKKGKSSTFFWKERKNWKKTVLYGNNKKVIFNLKVSLSGEFPGGTMIRILVLIEEGPIQSLVGELKSYKAVGLKKKKVSKGLLLLWKGWSGHWVWVASCLYSFLLLQ